MNSEKTKQKQKKKIQKKPKTHMKPLLYNNQSMHQDVRCERYDTDIKAEESMVLKYLVKSVLGFCKISFNVVKCRKATAANKNILQTLCYYNISIEEKYQYVCFVIPSINYLHSFYFYIKISQSSISIWLRLY